MIVVLIATITLLSSGASGSTTKHVVQAFINDSSINNDVTFKEVRTVTRLEWQAQPPTAPPTPLKAKPATHVIISHTATTPCFTQAQCALIVRFVQTFHIEARGLDDIAYNFLVGGDGLVYEGRGWGIQGAHTHDFNSKSIGIAFIGTFSNEKPTSAQLHAARELVQLGVGNEEISSKHKLLGQRQCVKTESPGQALYDIIQTWDHWSPEP